MDQYLILADGTIFHGKAVGVKGHAVGEVVFNTSQTGYQEILTDPSYLGQMITFTAPHIGNVGVNSGDDESPKVHAHGAIFRSFSAYHSNWRAEASLQDFFVKHKVVAISDIDTRALTIHLRERGSQNGCIVADGSLTPEEALHLAKQHPSLDGKNLAAAVSTAAPYVYIDPANSNAHIVVVDCGVKDGILRALAQQNVKISVVPQQTTFTALKALKPDGVLLSNGPGDPAACSEVIDLTVRLLAEKIPVFGICLGHQILALAAGGQTKKMKFGHHGANHPVKCLRSGAALISVQNHGFVVDEATLPECLTITHVSLFDGTIAGLEHKYAPAFSFQGHPEAAPGPHELLPLFQQFIDRICHAKKS
jgi:carbamoyl-phosphate synthase small subunit